MVAAEHCIYIGTARGRDDRTMQPLSGTILTTDLCVTARAGNPGEVTRPELVKYLHEQWTPLVKEYCDDPDDPP